MRSLVLATSALSASCTQDLKCDEDAAFLQGPSSPLHLLQPDDENDEPAFLLKTAKNLARQATRQTPEIVTAGIDSINAALPQMKTRLEDGHSRAQQRIQAQMDEITACHSSSSHGATRNDDLRGELATMTACREDQAAASQTQQVTCNAWDRHAGRLTFPSTSLPTSSSSRDRYLIAEQLRDWVDNEWAGIESQNAECEAATSHADAETERCTPVIANYNQVFCQHHEACNLLRDCHRHELEVYQTLRSESELGMASRQAQYRVVMQTECLLGLITEAMNANATIEETALDTCDGDVDVQHLELSFPDPEPSVDCPHPQAGDPECPEILLPMAWAGGEFEPPQAPAFILGTPGDVECPGTGYGTITDVSVCREAVAAVTAPDSNPPAWMLNGLAEHPPLSHPRAFESPMSHTDEKPCGCHLYSYDKRDIGRDVDHPWYTSGFFIPWMNENVNNCGYRGPHFRPSAHRDTTNYQKICQCQEASCQPPAQVCYHYFREYGDGSPTWDCPEGSEPVTEAECIHDVPVGVPEIGRAEGSQFSLDPPGCIGVRGRDEVYYNTQPEGTTGGWWLGYFTVCKREIDCNGVNMAD